MTSTFSQRSGSDSTSARPETLTNAKPEFDVVALFKENPGRGGEIKGSATVDSSLDFGSAMKLYGGDHNPLSGIELPKLTSIVKDDATVPVQLVEAATGIHNAQEALANGNPDRAAQWLQEAIKHLKEMGPDGKQTNSSPVDRTPSHGAGIQPSDLGTDISCGEPKSDSPLVSGANDGKTDPVKELNDTLTDALQALQRGNLKEVKALLSSLVSQVDALTGNDTPEYPIKPLGGVNGRPYWGVYGSPENPAIPSIVLPENLPGLGLNDPDISGTGGIRPSDLIDWTRIPRLPAIDEAPAFGLPEISNLPTLKFPGTGDSSNSKSPLSKLPGFPFNADRIEFL